MLVRVAPWGAPGSALKKAVRVRLAVSTMALHGDTRYAPGAGAIRRATLQQKGAPAEADAPTGSPLRASFD
jgi:ribosomal protein S12